MALSVIAVAFGAFAIAWPARAERIWGSERLSKLTPGSRVAFLRWYRVLGIMLCLSGVLLAIDSIAF